MTDSDNQIFGLAGMGLALPQERLTGVQMSEQLDLSIDELAGLGISRKVIPEAEDQPIPMAESAAVEALEEAGLEPEQVDLVLWTGEEYKDYIAQTASIRLQEEVGCKNAWAFDLVGQGTTLILGLRLARDMMLADETLNTVLLAGGSRNIDLVDPVNPDTRFLLPLAASGGAMVVQRGCRENQILDIQIQVDPTMADMVYVPGGGTENPFAPDNLGSPLMYFQVSDPDRMAAYLAEEFPDRLAGAAQSVLNGASPDYLALRHLNPAQRDRVLAALNLASEKSIPLYMWGCHGANDPLMSLVLAMSADLLSDGDLVCLANAGIGFTYAAATIRWGLEE